MDVPGRTGLSIFGDESLELWRDPLGYVNKRVKEHGPVFAGRILNKPTIFLANSAAVRELLCEKHENFGSGYQEYMYELFEKNVMFLEGDSWRDTRELLQQTFSHDNLQQTLDITRQLIQEHVSGTPIDEPLQAYQHLKVLTTQLSISLFLSHILTKAESSEVSELMTTHWHGIISVPINMRVPLLPWKSGYGKALSAKEKLMEIISGKLQSGGASPLADAVQSSSPSCDLAIRNILLFISALFPKGMASMMTSILLQLSKPENSRYISQCLSDDQTLEHVVLECQRLWPPFLGGRRVCSKSCQVAGYNIPEGHPVVYIAFTANRDGTVFPEPDEFRPERWADSVSDKELVWSFGGGPRTCLGKHLSTTILKEWLKHTLSTLSWQLSSGLCSPYKILPVIRPSDEVKVVFSRLEQAETQNDDTMNGQANCSDCTTECTTNNT